MNSGSKCCLRQFARVDWAIVLNTGFVACPGAGTRKSAPDFAQARNRPVGPVNDRGGQERYGHPQRHLALHRRRARGDCGPQRANAASHEIAAPEPNRIFPNAKCFSNPSAGPTLTRSASPRSREPAKIASSACCFWVAEREDLPVVPADPESRSLENQSLIRWSSRRLLLSVFISTAKTPLIAENPDFAQPETYLYQVDGSGLPVIDVNRAYPENPFPESKKLRLLAAF